jgi:hypothetical protein
MNQSQGIGEAVKRRVILEFPFQKNAFIITL